MNPWIYVAGGFAAAYFLLQRRDDAAAQQPARWAGGVRRELPPVEPGPIDAQQGSGRIDPGVQRILDAVNASGTGFDTGAGYVAPVPGATGAAPDPAGVPSYRYVGQQITAGQTSGTQADGSYASAISTVRQASPYVGSRGLRDYGYAP